MKLPQFVFEIGRDFGPSLRGQRVLVACSGGVDSVALLDAMSKLAARFDFEIAIAHIHHGPGSSARDLARDFVCKLAQSYNLKFYERASLKVLKSEESLRDFRKQALEDMMVENGFSKVALGHHADDLLETRLMRLIRGTGPRGLLAMRPMTKRLVRPFLNRTREQILNYAVEQKLAWLEDPSNEDRCFFRNWIRQEWLPMLDKKRVGSRVALGRSLDLLCEAVPNVTKPSPNQNRSEFHKLASATKRAVISAIATERGARDFGTSKIIEVLKRLERLEASRQKHAKFVVGGVEWSLTPDRITAVADAGPRS